MINITRFSFINAVFFFNIAIALFALLRRRRGFILHFSLLPLVFMVAISVFRVMFFVELPFTVAIDSKKILPWFEEVFTMPFFGGIRLIDTAILIWIIGTAYLIINYALQIVTVSRLLGHAEDTEDKQIRGIMQEVLKEHKSERAVKLVQLPNCTTPMIVGFFRPIICLPDIVFRDDELKNILRHEWSHFAHKDQWVKLSIYMMRAIFWWNPLAYLLKRELDHILEIQCDLRVTAEMDKTEQMHYLENLLRMMRLKQSIKGASPKAYRTAASMLFSEDSGEKIKQRFDLVLHQKQKHIGYKYMSYFLCFLMLVVCGISYGFVVQPGYEAPEGFSITRKNAYLEVNEQGTYNLYADGEYKGEVEEIDEEPFSSLSIISK